MAFSVDIEPLPKSISPPTILISIVKKTSASVGNSAENYFKSKKTTWVERTSVKGNISFSERVSSSRGPGTEKVAKQS